MYNKHALIVEKLLETIKFDIKNSTMELAMLKFQSIMALLQLPKGATPIPFGQENIPHHTNITVSEIEEPMQGSSSSCFIEDDSTSVMTSIQKS